MSPAASASALVPKKSRVTLKGRRHEVSFREIQPHAFDLDTRSWQGARTGYNVGFDVGGTKVTVVVTNNSDGSVVASDSWKHPKVGDTVDVTPQTLALEMARRAAALLTRNGIGFEQVQFVGAGLPGTPKGELMVRVPNLGDGFKGAPMNRLLVGHLEDQGIMVPEKSPGVRAARVGNDLDAGAVSALGSIPNVKNLLVVYAGTGIGAGIVVNNQVLHGKGEIGHHAFGARSDTLRPQARPWVRYHERSPTYDPNALEAWVGGDAMRERFAAELQANHDHGRSLVRSMVEGDLGQIHSGTIDQAARDGDAYAQGFIVEAADFLATAIVNLTGPLGMEALVVGGGVLEHSPALATLALEGAMNRLPHDIVEKPEIYVPKEGDLANAQGAAYLG